MTNMKAPKNWCCSPKFSSKDLSFRFYEEIEEVFFNSFYDKHKDIILNYRRSPKYAPYDYLLEVKPKDSEPYLVMLEVKIRYSTRHQLPSYWLERDKLIGMSIEAGKLANKYKRPVKLMYLNFLSDNTYYIWDITDTSIYRSFERPANSYSALGDSKRLKKFIDLPIRNARRGTIVTTLNINSICNRIGETNPETINQLEYKYSHFVATK